MHKKKGASLIVLHLIAYHSIHHEHKNRNAPCIGTRQKFSVLHGVSAYDSAKVVVLRCKPEFYALLIITLI